MFQRKRLDSCIYSCFLFYGTLTKYQWNCSYYKKTEDLSVFICVIILFVIYYQFFWKRNINFFMKSEYLLFLCFLTVINSFKPLRPLLRKVNKNFPQDQIPQKIFAAQIHYSRIPHQYWQHRLRMAKALGFNALSVYVMWNFHEINKGQFDFLNADRDLKSFLQLAQNYSFYILLRPGPYVCADWDFGGMPARLLSVSGLKIRQNNPLFLEEVKTYFTSLSQIVKDFIAPKNGRTSNFTIILLQIQNEYGYYGQDKQYISALIKIWEDLGVDLPKYYVDAFKNIDKTYWPGANIGINGAVKEQQYQSALQRYPQSYIFGGESYSGWLTRWGQNWSRKEVEEFVKEFQFLMKANHSFSMHMAHGGTNFGLTAGANHIQGKNYDYRAVVTSYEYDAPINEQGLHNQKYHVFRDLAKKYATWQIPSMPEGIKMITIPIFNPSKFADLFQNLPSQPHIKKSSQLYRFEDPEIKMYNQGFVLYQTELQKSGLYFIKTTIHDFALVYVNGKFLKYLDRSKKTEHQFTLMVQKQQKNTKLQILVESMGHICFGNQMSNDFKGIIQFEARVLARKQAIMEDYEQNLQVQQILWDIYSIPLGQNVLKWKKLSQQDSFPRLFRYNLTLQQTGDTYLNMQNWDKGYVIVNGKNLGRYWSKGPQQKLFLPGVWLKRGVNDIVVLDLLNWQPQAIKGQFVPQMSRQDFQDQESHQQTQSHQN